MKPLMLDLFSGEGGASSAFLERGWDVVRVEISEDQPAEFRDVRAFTWRGRRPDFVWASPPCTEFSTANPFRDRSVTPESIDLVHHALRVIKECQPRFWVIENVQGACKFFRPILGEHRQAFGPFFLWGEFPRLVVDGCYGWKSRKFKRFHDRAADRRACARARATIPPQLSRAMLDAIEATQDLPFMDAAAVAAAASRAAAPGAVA